MKDNPSGLIRTEKSWEKVESLKMQVIHLNKTNQLSTFLNSNRTIQGTFHENKLLVHVSPKTPNQVKETNSQIYSQDLQLQELEIAKLPMGLNVISKSSRVFVKLQKSKNSCLNKMNFLNEISLEYMKCLEEEHRDGTRQEIRVWELVHLLYLNQESDLRLKEGYLNWLNQFVPSQIGLALPSLASYISPSHAAEYWPVILDCLCRGKYKIILNLLEKASINSVLMSRLQSCIVEMPLLETMGVLEFRDAWSLWSRSVGELYSSLEHSLKHSRSVKETQEPSHESYILQCLGVLSGQSEIISQVSENWQVELGALILYKNPLIHIDELESLSSLLSDPSTQENTTDKLESSFVKRDLYSAIGELSSWNVWFAVHLIDLLFELGYLQGDMQDNECGHEIEHGVGENQETLTLRDWFIIQYSQLLFENSLAFLSFDYLISCTRSIGRNCIIEYISYIPWNRLDKNELQDGIQFLESNQFNDELKEVYKVLGRYYLSNKEYGRALEYYILAECAPRVHYVASLVLKNVEYKELVDICSRLDSNALAYDSILLVVRYKEFTSLCIDKNYKEAALLLVEMLSSGNVDESFESILLSKSCLFLNENDDVYLDSHGTLELLRVLEHHSSNHSYGKHLYGNHSYKVQDLKVDAKKELQKIQLKLIKNLSRAHLL